MGNNSVSFIIPVFNAENYIRHCIDSVLAQDYQDFEIILINDGSKDQSDIICQEYAQRDNRIVYLQQANSGVSTARNNGISHATGEWISFIDADDYIEPDYCSILQSIDSKNADWIFCGTSQSQEDKTPTQSIASQQLITQKSQIQSIWSQHMNTLPFRVVWGKFFRKSIITRNCILFDKNLRYGEDTLFNLQYLTHVSTILFCGEKSAKYVYYSNNIGAVKKYRCDVPSIISFREQALESMQRLNIHNDIFERFLLFTFTMIEHNYLGKEEDIIRRNFYRSNTQLNLEKQYLRQLRLWDQVMYKLFKHTPHHLIYPLAAIYLKHR